MTETENILQGLEEALETVARAIRRLDQELMLLAEEELAGRIDVNRASELLVAANIAKANLTERYKEIEKLTAESMKGANREKIKLPSGIQLEYNRSRSRSKWKHQDLAKEVARRIAEKRVDFDTGEVLMSDQQMIEELLRYASPGYWRVKELMGIGINADDYSDAGEMKTTVIVRKVNNYYEDEQ